MNPLLTLSQAIESVAVRSVSGSIEIPVTSVAYDSRHVEPGAVFCALAGQGTDGNAFVDAAVEAGAVAVVSERAYPAEHAVTWLRVRDARAAMAAIAASIHGHPSLAFPVVGITGTNGKTTTASLLHHLFGSILRRAGLIGTIHYAIGEETFPASHTTPESVEVHRLLAEMRDADCRAVAMEVSSHGLAQHRVGGVAFDVGVFANLSQDHLDYHGDMESYFASKRRLFEQMDGETRKSGTAVVNIDDVHGARLASARYERLKILTFGRSVKADFRASEIRSDFDGTRFALAFRERRFLVRTPLIGAFNVYNAVAAIASAYAVGLNLREIVAKIADAPQVPGRLEAVMPRKINYRLFVDYAHTPDALENVLATLRGLEPRRIITVFGCGGDRDPTKRAPMARAAALGSDYCVLTSDNPRTEDPWQILEDAEKGFPGVAGRDYEVIEDRREAIKRAVFLSEERDIVLVAGKGHETYQEIHGVRHDFDDRSVSARCIHEKAERGPE